MVTFNEDKQKKQLSELREKDEENLLRQLSGKYHIPYLDLSAVSVSLDALQTIPEDIARKSGIAIFDGADKKIQVAVRVPNDPKVLTALDDLKQKGFIPSLFLVSQRSLEKVWSRYADLSHATGSTAGALDISNEEIEKVIKKTRTLADIKQMVSETLNLERRYRTTKILEIALAGALALKASDLHLEPEELSVRLRYRLDGILIEIATIDHGTYNLILSRIKLLSGLKLNIKRAAQDGRFTINVGPDEIEIRTSILPGAYNESVVMRVLNPHSISVPLEKLGIHPRLFKLIDHEINKPNGMILNTGPTGSGKTTTLYAFLKKIYSSETKIITIENPIEYHLEGIVQTQTDNKGDYTFAAGLRSALRQDPDVIMVGEIRDSETAEVAINAALTGHLVFSTLHTNNAAGTFPRLIDLGINPKVITSSLSVAMAQRLVRTIKKDEAKEVPIVGKDRETIDRILASIADQTYLDGIQRESMWVPKENDGLTGYKGRIGVFEAIFSDPKIEEVIQTNPSEREIIAAAAPQNILNMEQDGVIKVLQGVTSLDELRRVIDLKE